MAEVAISSLIAGILIVATLRGLAASVRTSLVNDTRSAASRLSYNLLSEITSQPYYDAELPNNFGPEPGESAGTSRIEFDDVDDWHGWTNSPPVSKNGTDLGFSNAWSRSVTVDLVAPESPSATVASELGARRITVTTTVARPNAYPLVSTAVAVRSLASSKLTKGTHLPALDALDENLPPVPVIAMSPSSGASPLSVSFDGTGSTDPDGDALQINWRFSDSTTATGPTASKSFSTAAGTSSFWVELTATDSNGASSTIRQAIIVFE